MPSGSSSPTKDASAAKSSTDKKAGGKKPEDDGELDLTDLKRRPTKGEGKWGEMSVQDLGSLRPPADGEGAWGEQSVSGFNF